jgi:cytochrome P450
MYELDPPDESARKAVRASIEFGDYLRALLAERRRKPGDDLISGLAAVVDDGDTLTETELIATCVLLLNAGHEASVNGAGNSWWTLFRHPDALARLQADPALAAWDTFATSWKAHIACFCPILSTAVAAIVLRYGRDLAVHPQIRYALMLLLTFAFATAGIAGGLGALVTRVAPLR